MQDPMHAYLITSGSPSERVKAIEKHLRDLHIETTDIVYLTDENDRIGIDAVRAFDRQLILTPYQSPFVAGVILQADRLTVEAQNALLKVLEEPAPHVVYFVETASSDLLLPTIVSRLTLLSGETPAAILTADNECKKTIQELLSSSPGKKLTIIETIATDRIKTKEWVEKAIVTCRAMLLEDVKNSTLLILTRKLLIARGELALNINPKLVLDTVFLSL
jgi:DNA polymerase III delta prime subunit